MAKKEKGPFCPKCGNKDNFKIQGWEVNAGEYYVEVDGDQINTYDDKSVSPSETGYYRDGSMSCLECDFSGVPKDFKMPKEYLGPCPLHLEQYKTRTLLSELRKRGYGREITR